MARLVAAKEEVADEVIDQSVHMARFRKIGTEHSLIGRAVSDRDC